MKGQPLECRGGRSEVVGQTAGVHGRSKVLLTEGGHGGLEYTGFACQKEAEIRPPQRRSVYRCQQWQTSGLVVGVGKAVLDSEKDNASLDRQYNDTIWVLDERGWYHRYTHLYSFDPSVQMGGRVDMGQKIATLGKEGGSGGWSHLHYEILSRQASGRLGTLEGYAFLWEAYLRQCKPHVIAVARPHQAALVGEKVLLDGSRSY